MLRAVLEQAIRTTADPGVGSGVTPGGVLAYGDQGRHVATIAFGRSHLPGLFVPVFEVTAETIYDVASLTKPIATAAVLMSLDIDVDAPVRPLVPELVGQGKERITFAHLLGHASGFPAHVRFYERLRAGERGAISGRPASARETLLEMAGATELEREPGTAAVYSDLGYIVLGFAIERLTGQRLDAAVRARVTEPLGMRDTFYVDLDQSAAHMDIAALRQRIAPTEICPYRGLVHGEVHDENAHAGGGIFGHAGLFATADDVARFARAMVHAAAGQCVKGAIYGLDSDIGVGSGSGAKSGAGPGFGIAPDAVRRFLATSAAPDTTWRLGWDRPALLPARSHAGDAWPRDGVGHLGFTGCSMWLDIERGRYAVLLTNRVHPRRDLPGIADFRRAVMDAVVAELDRAR